MGVLDVRQNSEFIHKDEQSIRPEPEALITLQLQAYPEQGPFAMCDFAAFLCRTPAPIERQRSL